MSEVRESVVVSGSDLSARRRPRARVLAAAGAAALLVLVGATTLAGAWDGRASGAGDVDTSECMTLRVCGPDAQGLVADDGDQADVVRLIGDLGATEKGFGDLAVTNDPPGVLVWWSGDLPPHLLGVIADADEVGVAVYVRPAPYGSQELLALAGRTFDAAAREGIVLTTTGPAQDFSGLAVTGPVVSVDAATQQRVTEIVAGLQPGVDVTFDADPGPIDPLED